VWTNLQSLPNFSGDKDKQDRIGSDDQEAGNEKGNETSSLIWDEAGVGAGNATVLIDARQRAHAENEDNQRRNAPRRNVIPLFVGARVAILRHNHSVKVEGNAKRPAKIGEKRIMRQQTDEKACANIHHNRRLRRNQKARKGNNQSKTQEHDQLDGIRANLQKTEEEGQTHAKKKKKKLSKKKKKKKKKC
jgi:hypothetical protein